MRRLETVRRTIATSSGILLVAALAFTASDATADRARKSQRVELVTSLGTIQLELDAAKAPRTVANFVDYVKSGFYDGTIFHRVIATFMIQGGGFDTKLKKKPTRAPIQNEANNGLKNDRGTIAMARTPDPHSATAQFFINVKDNDALNHRSKDDEGWGYCVFGKVVKGIDVVDKIKAVPTGPKGEFSKDCPEKDVVIKKARLL
jgi:peptidyl-prolyl cis-trans isomerase B (cyclophilin B)